MPISYFLPCVSLLFSHQKVTYLRNFLHKRFNVIYKKQTRQLDKSEAVGNQWCIDRNNSWISYRDRLCLSQGSITGLASPIPRDPVGIQTQDLQNRNLTLYSAKLRDLNCFRAAAFVWNADAKVLILIQNEEWRIKNYDLLTGGEVCKLLSNIKDLWYFCK